MEQTTKKTSVGIENRSVAENRPNPVAPPPEAQYPTYAEVLEMIDRRIASLQVYIVESEITQAQDAVKAVVSQASF